MRGAVALSACGVSHGPGSSGLPTSAGTATATNSSPTPTTAVATSPSNRLAGIPVYWIAESRRSFALYREFGDVPDTGELNFTARLTPGK